MRTARPNDTAGAITRLGRAGGAVETLGEALRLGRVLRAHEGTSSLGDVVMMNAGIDR
ncbi:Hypothetical protein A7982_01006 [Minicystis rosea]|nr:Hypothetical protein A7982_01006 [Minicystis rosea]